MFKKEKEPLTSGEITTAIVIIGIICLLIGIAIGYGLCDYGHRSPKPERTRIESIQEVVILDALFLFTQTFAKSPG